MPRARKNDEDETRMIPKQVRLEPRQVAWLDSRAGALGRSTGVRATPSAVLRKIIDDVSRAEEATGLTIERNVDITLIPAPPARPLKAAS